MTRGRVGLSQAMTVRGTSGGSTRTVLGTATQASSEDLSGYSGHFSAIKAITVPSAGFLTGISAWFEHTGPSYQGRLTGTVYTDDAGSPALVVAQGWTARTSILVGTAGRFIGIPIGKWLAAGTYHLRVGVEASDWGLGYDGTGTDRWSNDGMNWFDYGPADIFDYPSFTAASKNYSIYADFIGI